MARILRGETDAINSLLTHGAGIKHLGLNGDIRWRGPGWQPDPDNPTGPPIPTQSFQTWSVKDVAREVVVSRLAAEGAVASANGKNSRIYSLEPAFGLHNPATGALLVAGDTWWQYADDDGNYLIVGSWVFDGEQWQAETLTDAVLGALDVNKLVVVGSADINELVAQAIAAKMIEADLIRTTVHPETGFWAVMDSFGFRVINEYGPEGDPIDVIRLGPDLTQLLQLGTAETGMATIDSAGGVTGVHGSFENLYVDGRRITATAADMPAGIVSQAVMDSGRSRRLNGRDIVLGLDAALERGRVYQILTNNPVCDTEHDTCEPQLELHWTLDGSYPGNNWAASKKGESIIGWFPRWRNLPGMHSWIDLRNQPAGPPMLLRAAVTLGNRTSNGWTQLSAVGGGQPFTMWVEDKGTRFENLGVPFYDTGGGTPPPAKREYTTRWHPTGWATYIRGGSRDYTPKPTQGMWSQWDRSCYFFFDDMTAALAGAQIRRITLFAWADHWGQSTGIGRWHRHGMYGAIPESGQQSTFMVDTPGWPPGAARTINIIPEEFGLWQSGAARGFGFTSWETGHQFYGQFSPLLSAHFIEIVYER